MSLQGRTCGASQKELPRPGPSHQSISNHIPALALSPLTSTRHKFFDIGQHLVGVFIGVYVVIVFGYVSIWVYQE